MAQEAPDQTLGSQHEKLAVQQTAIPLKSFSLRAGATDPGWLLTLPEALKRDPVDGYMIAFFCFLQGHITT